MNDLKLQKYRDLGAILTDSFVYIRVHYKSLGKALLLFVLPFYLISGVLVGFTFASLNLSVTAESFIGGGFLSGILLLMLSSGALLTVTMTHIQLARDNEEVILSEIIDHFGRNFITLVALYILIILAVIPGLFFLLIPGIYVAIKFFVAPAVAVIENKNPFESLKRSWDLVQGHWWFTFATYLVMNLVTTFMSYVLIIPMSIFIGFMSASGADSNEVLGTGIGIFYGLLVVVASLFSVLMLIALSLQYFNLIERKEGVGLRQQIEELG